MSARPSFWDFLGGGDAGVRGIFATNVAALITNLVAAVVELEVGARRGILALTVAALGLSLVVVHRLRRQPPVLRPTARQQPRAGDIIPPQRWDIELCSQERCDHPTLSVALW